jgi:hypothetical protein
LWFSFLAGSEPRPLAEASRLVDAVTGILAERRIRDLRYGEIS